MKILVLHEKHVTQYLNAGNTKDDIADAMLKVIVGRYGPSGPYYICQPTKPVLNLGLTQEQISELPKDSPIRLTAENEFKNYKRQMANYNNNVLTIEQLQICLDESKPIKERWKNARWFMDSRLGYEYEDWELVAVSDIYYS